MARTEHCAGVNDCLFSQSAQVCIERDDLAPSVLPVKQGTFGYFAGEHLFQTQRLRAELHLVRAVGFRAATLVFDRARAGRMAVQFHYIRHPVQAQPTRGNLHRAQGSPVGYCHNFWPGRCIGDDYVEHSGRRGYFHNFFGRSYI